MIGDHPQWPGINPDEQRARLGAKRLRLEFDSSLYALCVPLRELEVKTNIQSVILF